MTEHTYNLSSNRQIHERFDGSTIKSVRVYSDPKLMHSPDMWEVDDYYEFRVDVADDGTSIQFTHFPMELTPHHHVNEDGYTDPRYDHPVMNERIILYPKWYKHEIVLEFWEDYTRLNMWGNLYSAYTVIEWEAPDARNTCAE